MATGKGVGRKATRQAATTPRRRVSSSSPRLITLLTDFGTSDHFVAAMKGAILTKNPDIRIVDITHNVPAQDVAAAAFTLLAVYESFPARTIHVAVVDPGVGSKREPLLIEAANQIFIGPNNGIFSYIIERHAFVARVIINERWFRHPTSATFHGRDLFAPVAAAVACEERLSSFGPKINKVVKLPALTIKRSVNRELVGHVIHIDHFGNCITNFTKADLPGIEQSTISLNGHEIRSFRRFFSDARAAEHGVFVYWGSAGFLEIAIQNGSAAKALKIRVGDRVLASA
jgi:S-adenosylmethionine hydrolase